MNERGEKDQVEMKEEMDNYDYKQEVKDLEQSMKRVIIYQERIESEKKYADYIRASLGKFINYKESLLPPAERQRRAEYREDNPIE